jgi:hypothetical protein
MLRIDAQVRDYLVSAVSALAGIVMVRTCRTLQLHSPTPNTQFGS